jgi:hypothetical protein
MFLSTKEVVMSGKVDLKSLQNQIKQGLFWLNGYQEVENLNEILTRQYHLETDKRDPIELIKGLAAHLRPQLPEGYIWLENGKDLKIYRHVNAPPHQFKIHLFGPDKLKSKQRQIERIQYLVVDQVGKQKNIPIHGFAMAKKEGFSKDLRESYPFNKTEFRKDGKATVLGHIIDYQDTLGKVDDENISTLFAQNYKPEPKSIWALNIRTQLVGERREIEGSYSEVMLYGYNPLTTDGLIPIPKSVFFETFNYGADRLKGFYVPFKHPCHIAEKSKEIKEIEPVKYWKKQLIRKKETFPALVIDKNRFGKIYSLEEYFGDKCSNLDVTQANVRQAYHLKRAAELEFSRADAMMKQAIYAKTHKAPNEVIEHWLLRAEAMAQVIARAWEAQRPAFSAALLNTMNDHFIRNFSALTPTMQQSIRTLTLVADKIITGFNARTINAFSQNFGGNKSLILVVGEDAYIADLNPGKPEKKKSVIIDCRNIPSTSTTAMNRVKREIKGLEKENVPVKLIGVHTRLSKELFPKLSAATNIKEVTISTPIYLKSVSKEADANLTNNVKVSSPKKEKE